jgi:hypothetical protein
MVTAQITIFSLLLAVTWLPQDTPKLNPQAPAPEGQATAPSSNKKPKAERTLATIIQSGSTNTRPYKVTIRRDGSATIELGGSNAPALREVPAGTVDAKTLRQLLREVHDVTKIPAGRCAKSVSFGTSTEIAYAGKTSGDLQCIRADTSAEADTSKLQAGQELSKFVQTTLQELRVNASRIGSGP